MLASAEANGANSESLTRLVSAAARFHRRRANQIGGHVRRIENFHVEFEQADKRTAKVGGMVAAAVHEDAHRRNHGAMLPYNIDGFLHATATGDHVLYNHEPFAGPDLEATAEHQTSLFLFYEDMSFSQGASHLVANNDATHRRRDDRGAVILSELRGKRAAYTGS